MMYRIKQRLFLNGGERLVFVMHLLYRKKMADSTLK
jgi:hypothetical protein